LSESIIELAENPAKMAHLQSKARSRVETSFSLSAMVQELETLYLGHKV
jgi:glycosyltransferase involved in cell wall biosynthesis